ncbi:hypothetical protein [Roseovarius nanhaiticus]|uniref:CTP synthetase n=1 Tax=Roseovarius nanhaiticus TaxID=573024 RepID=A0A1N7G5W4_9RHOB|nr:hypothetical protein [Roseovarius nanhaiticus]SEK36351.1 hypothetical protein SAMN05216208_0432 [Roseovarius nanhaiticus]SIS07952.1 hypothetical protein SAMN05421666_1704 [Roseovarius nanhaiticus]
MFMLASFLNIIIGTSMAGIGVIIALVAGYDGTAGVVTGAAAGFVLSLPVTWLVLRQLMKLGAVQKN